MKFEYFILNLIIISGPAILSFDRKVRYVARWPYAFISISMVMVPFIIWDVLVTGRHWWFNTNFTIDFRLAGLPIEEWLFFISVPFALLFIWEIIEKRMGNPIQNQLRFIHRYLPTFIIIGLILYAIGKEYTGLTFIFLGLVGLLDTLLKTEILARKRTFLYLAILTALTFIFNGYLTARPVVFYDPDYQLNFRVITIPIEDFGYGFSLVLLNTIIFEKLKGIRYG